MKRSNSMRLISTAIIACALVFLTSCKLQKEGLVVMTDESYKATLFANNNKIKFGSPDGIVWHKGKLYFADEGGVALESWTKQEGLKTLIDSRFGTQSPEDLVIDSQDNIFFTDDDAGGLWEFTANGRITKPESMVFDDRGNLYIADNEDDVLYLLDGEKKLHRVVDRKDSFSPETIFYSKGSLYITDSHNNKLYVYTPNEELKTIAAFSGQLKNVQGVTLDDEGNIYLSVQTDLKRKVGAIIEISKENSDSRPTDGSFC